MNCYTFCREMEYTATAYLKQKAYGHTPEEAYAKLEDSMWEFDDEPSLDEDAAVQIADDEDVQEAKRWNEAHCENGWS